MRRLAKQIIIGTLYLVLFTLIGFGVWTLRAPAESCTDGLHNQNEVDVDCGGVCGVCRTTPQEARLLGTYVVADSNTDASAFTLENPNPQWGLLHLPYTLTLTATDGTETTVEGSAYLLPLERKTFTELVTREDGAAPAETVRVVLGEATWVEPPGDVRDISLSLLNPTFTRRPQPNFAAEVRGVVRNDSPFSYDAIDVHVVVRDSATDEVVGIRRTEMRTLTANERREFVVQWRENIPLIGEPDLEIATLTNIFLNENFIREFGILEEFQSFEKMLKDRDD